MLVTKLIYHRVILDYARAAIGSGRLEEPHASATVDNPKCGDRVTIQLLLTSGRISKLAHLVRGCILCEAAASTLSQNAVGLTPIALQKASTQFVSMIQNNGPVPEDWPNLAVFRPVCAERNRHNCVLLPFIALGQALTGMLGLSNKEFQ